MNFSRARNFRAFATAIVLLLGAAARSSAQIDFSSLNQWRSPGSQRAAVCQGSCGGGCGACPRVVSAEERAEARAEAERVAEEERQRRLREARERVNQKVNARRTSFVGDKLGEISKTIRASLPVNTKVLAPYESFSFAGRAPSPYPEETLAAQVGGWQTPASALSSEDLRRAAAILGAASPSAGGGLSDEDGAYVAGQAALAMEGAPVALAVPDSPPLGADAEKRMREFAQSSREFVRSREAFDRAIVARVKAESDLAAVQSDLTAGRGDKAALEAKRDQLSALYLTALRTEYSSKDAVRDAKKKVTIIVLP